jgi:hypothetical protein
MGGGLMQLVAYGAQDIYLTGNPQITFFKVVYRRHTNFSMESILQTFNGTAGTGASTLTSTISRNGDLVSNLMLEATITGASDAETSSNYWTNNTGHALIKEAEIEIGGQRIDRHYSQWLDIENEVNVTDYGSHGGENSHDAPGLNKSTSLAQSERLMINSAKYMFYVPLKFWFCRNPGLALPLIALQYHEVKLKIQTRALSALLATTGAATSSTGMDLSLNLYADYIYLDTDERRRFAQVSHEYLIEQVQRESGAMPSGGTFKLNFNHPVKELLWVVQDDFYIKEDDENANPRANIVGGGATSSNGSDYFNYSVAGTTAGTTTGATPAELVTADGVGGYELIGGKPQLHGFGTAKLKLNGHDRFSARAASYFHRVQLRQAGHAMTPKHIYGYSFALKPIEHQPSGTCNFSRIDNAEFIFAAKDHTGASGSTAALDADSTITVYAINYNVLRIMSGMGGLAYSN